MVSNGCRIEQHDALKPFPLEDGSVDVVITSPPYWGLRDYGVCGQIGLESHPQEYINHLLLVACEVKRVLKKSGSFYLNLGDTYCSVTKWGGESSQSFDRNNNRGYTSHWNQKVLKKDGGWIQPKQLMLIPSRVAVALQDDGWILRNDIIWHKPNPMPCSVKDRLNNTYEHMFHFVKSRKYYYNLDSIREPYSSATLQRVNYAFNECKGDIQGSIKRSGNQAFADRIKKLQHEREYKRSGTARLASHLFDAEMYSRWGKNPGDFWEICTQPFTSCHPDLEHFAVFPEELVVKPLKSSCPPDGVVLDPFCGRGTVGRVAKQLGFRYVLFDLKPEYVELARLYVNGQKRNLIKYQQKLKTYET